MRYYLISDDPDTAVGMRLAGIEGTVVTQKEAAEEALRTAADDPEIGLILITESLSCLCRETVDDLKLNRARPLVLTVPDRNATGQREDTIDRYLREAMGIS